MKVKLAVASIALHDGWSCSYEARGGAGSGPNTRFLGEDLLVARPVRSGEKRR